MDIENQPIFVIYFSIINCDCQVVHVHQYRNHFRLQVLPVDFATNLEVQEGDEKPLFSSLQLGCCDPYEITIETLKIRCQIAGHAALPKERDGSIRSLEETTLKGLKS